MVNETNDTKNNTPAAYLVAEVCYCMAFFMLKKLLDTHQVQESSPYPKYDNGDASNGNYWGGFSISTKYVV